MMRCTRGIWRAAFAAALLAALGGCSSVNPLTGERQFTAFMSPAKEAAVGAEEHPKILERFGGAYDDLAIGAYAAEIGGRLVHHPDFANQRFTITVLNSPEVNAFALPGGYVYLTRGLMALANSEAEVAAVLAHEIGHVAARHTAERFSQAMVAQLGTVVLGAITESSQVADLAQLGAGLYLAGYSREQEFEADLLGVRYLARTGYDPRAAESFLTSLGREHQLQARIEGEDAVRDRGFFATHPRTVERIQRAIASAAVSGAQADAPQRRAEYLDRLDDLVFGDSAEQGFVRGRTFSHPGMRLTFTAPPGFRLVNTTQAVFAEGPDDAIIRLDSADEDARADPYEYLRRDWARGVSLREFERLTINGLPAATARAQVSRIGGARDLRLVAVRLDPDTMVRLLFVTPVRLAAGLATEYRRTTHSIRRLSRAEAARLKPLRLRIEIVRPGDTEHTFAERMVVPQLALEWFRTLNALEPGESLRPGRRVKLIEE